MTSGHRLRTWTARLTSFFPGHTSPQSEEVAPLRAELFSADQMDQHGQVLARRHGEAFVGSRDRLLARLDENETALLAACKLVTTAVRAECRITPAGEWLLDNYYLIEEQIRNY